MASPISPPLLSDCPQWRSLLAPEFSQDYFQGLWSFLAQERQGKTIFPPEDLVFQALKLTPLDQVKVLILGQDPYHDHGQAQGLSFSVPSGFKLPPSLRNIYKELAQDLAMEPPTQGDLSSWAHQGVLLLNAVLTVEAHQPHAHQNRGWERFTDAIIRGVSDQGDRVVFILWGKAAQKKETLIDRRRHHIIATAHPSPLAARRGFFGSRPFSRTNHWLESQGKAPINWRSVCGDKSP